MAGNYHGHDLAQGGDVILRLRDTLPALDTESERHVQSALHNLTRNRTTLVIAHRLSTIVHADEILVVDRGRVIERGTHEELMGARGFYHRLYVSQFKGQHELVPELA